MTTLKDKIEKGLVCCVGKDADRCRTCPYKDKSFDCVGLLVADAIELVNSYESLLEAYKKLLIAKDKKITALERLVEALKWRMQILEPKENSTLKQRLILFKRRRL